LGFKVIELEKNKKDSFCCGAGGGLKGNRPELANNIAKNILDNVKTKKLITTCPMCYAHFKENSKDIQVLELSEVLV
jgi:Fe-S oxidoreductase